MFGYWLEPGREERFTHAETVNGPLILRLALSETLTKSLSPSRLTACAIFPWTIVGNTVPMSEALLPCPLLSRAVVPDTLAESKDQQPRRLLVMPPPEETALKLATRVRFAVAVNV